MVLINVLINVWLNYMNYMNISECPWKSHPFILNHVFQNAHNHNKTISDGKYLARHMPVIGHVHPIKIENGELLTTWHTFWCHDQLFDVRCVSHVMTNFLLSWSILDFMTNFFTSWHIFYFMTNCWRYDKLFTSWRVFDCMTNLLTSWCLFDILTNFVLVMTNLLSSWHVFDIMTNLLTPWRNFWRHDNVFHTMTNFLTFLYHDELFDVMTCFDVIANFLTLWHVFDLKFVDVMTNFFK